MRNSLTKKIFLGNVKFNPNECNERNKMFDDTFFLIAVQWYLTAVQGCGTCDLNCSV